jgi:hypothetical protein
VKHEPRGARGKRGAVLAISLMLMMTMTLLAVSTMRTATLELMMVGNAEHREIAFQAAQTGLAVAIGLLDDNELALVAEEGWSKKNAVTSTPADTGHSFTTSLRYLYRGDPPPEHGAAGQKALYFEIDATGWDRGRNTRAVQTQGFWVFEDGSRPVNLTYWFPGPGP